MEHTLNLVNGTNLNSEQLTQIAKLIFYTGYFNESSRDNKLGLDAVEFQKHINVLPVKDHLRVLLDNDNNVAGFHLALTKQETIDLFAHEENYHAETPDNIRVGSSISKLYMEESNQTDLVVHFTSFRDDSRGQGIFKLFRQDLVNLAKIKNCNRLFSVVWETKTEYLKTLNQYGAQIRKILDFTDTIYKDRLINLTTDITLLQKILDKDNLNS